MKKNIQIFSILIIIESLAILLWLASLPSGGSGLFSLSPLRIIMLLGALLPLLLALILIYLLNVRNYQLIERIEHLQRWPKKQSLAFWIIIFTMVLFSISILTDQWELYANSAIYARLLPLLIFGGIICLQTVLLLLWTDISHQVLKDFLVSLWKPTLISFSIFVITILFINLTKIGITSDSSVGLNWGPPGTPIGFRQIYFIFLLSILVTMAWRWLQSSSKKSFILEKRYQNWLVFGILWGIAVIIWWSEPLPPSHFAPSLVAPNYEQYPFSDADIFDRFAYHLINGIGFTNQLVRRPLYTGMLALFHGLVGSNYENTILLQILILAFIPLVIFLLVSKMSNRLAGLTVAGLVILREQNAIALANKIEVSHAKLMMSDLPAMLGILLIIYIFTKFIDEKKQNGWLALITGALIGLTALIRAQVLILIPVLMLFVLIAKWPLRNGGKYSLILLIGAIAALSPWLWRNWQISSTLVIDDGGEQRLLARNYTLNPSGLPNPLPGETQQEFSERLSQNVRDFIFDHPDQVLFFMANHFFHNIAAGVTYIAPQYSPDLPKGIVTRVHIWKNWDDEMLREAGPAIILTLIIISIGIAIAWRKQPYIGILPLVIFIFYSAGNSLARSSGWRFSLPVDWILLAYYGIAIGSIPFILSKAISTAKGIVSIPVQTGKATLLSKTALFAALILIGASVPIAEYLIPDANFAPLSEKAKLAFPQQGFITDGAMQTFLEQENAQLVTGISLYPRYYQPENPIYLEKVPKDFTYLHFWFINEGDRQAILPLQNTTPPIPHAGKITILGCETKNYLLVWAIYAHETNEILVSDWQTAWECPPYEPDK